VRGATNVYLVGMMGAGKTTAGKRLARQLDRHFVDLDQLVEGQTGVSVATIFEIEGEAGFRVREAQALARLADERDMIVATGGGVVLSPVNRARIMASGFVVYLHAPPELLYTRTRHDKNRPLLRVADPQERIASLVERRDPLYREVADIVVESGAGLSNTVSCIEKALGRIA
jgi:shikimate kinase